MFGYYENSTYFYIPDLQLPVITTIGNLVENHTHQQSSIEILCVLRGEVQVKVAKEDYRLQPGDILTIQKHQPHYYHDGTEDGLQLLLTFDESLLHLNEEAEVGVSTVGAEAWPRNHPVVQELRSAIGALTEAIQPVKLAYYRSQVCPPIDSAAWHRIRMETHHIAMLLTEHRRPRRSAAPEYPASLISCIEYVNSHYPTLSGTEDMARACGFNPRSVRRLFQQYMGISFSQYLAVVRLTAAANLLQSTDCSIADAAEDVGLSVSSLYRLFQQETGMAPGEYVRQARRVDSLSPYMAIPDGQFQHLTQQSLFYSAEDIDWDWVSGRRGWDFD